MRRSPSSRLLTMLSALALALAGGVPGGPPPEAAAAPGPDVPAAGAPEHTDDRPDPAAAERRELNRRAVEMVVSGEADVQRRGGSQAVQVAPGRWAEYGVQERDAILSFLVEFGDTVDPRFPLAAPGPQRNEIPAPDRAVDNTTYWTEDFDREHYLDMFFAADGESLTDLYEEMSGGRYGLEGDVGDWVTVPWNSASYGETESPEDMTRFVQDTADAWYAAQLADGRTREQIDAYLKTFDEWDRYDHDRDGDFDEPDGYIDHFQAIHAGVGEEADGPTSAIWSHRWAVNQDGAGTEGPAMNPFGGIRIGESELWIRDYTTEPENGGLGVFAHEYAHDLGLPDLYDTSGGENGTGFWTLMSGGSWLSWGQEHIGTTPNHMGAWEKLQLGWLDYEVVVPGTASTHVLNPSVRSTGGVQALVVVLPVDAQGRARYYIAENRQYVGYDATLRPGPYNFGRLESAPRLVEHFPYQDGLSITYWNTAVPDNKTAEHPGTGLALPVDANPKALTWSDGAVVRNRIQSFDATFGLEHTDPIRLHREVSGAMTTLDVPARSGVPVFDDTDPAAYYDPANPQGSVLVAGTGTTIQVLASTPQGTMTVRVE